MGNQVLAQMLGDLLSRCALITLMYQTHAAAHSSEEHVAIVDAIAAGDEARAVELMDEHLNHVETSPGVRPKLPTRHLDGAFMMQGILQHHLHYPRPGRVRSQSTAGQLAGRRPHRGSVRAELRGGWRKRGAVTAMRAPEQFLSEMFNPPAFADRHLTMEGIYEYGSRVGVWRLLREFERRKLPLTVFGMGMALQRHPEVTAAFVELGHEIACHGWRWISYQNVDRGHRARTHAPGHTGHQSALTGSRPLGWYTGRDSRPVAWWWTTAVSNTTATTTATTCHSGCGLRRTDGAVVPHLVVPYTLDANDMRFALPQGFSRRPFYQYLRDSFDALYAEGAETPRMMSIGMHCRLLGRPGRIVALQRFLDHIAAHDRVWVCRRMTSPATGNKPTLPNLTMPLTSNSSTAHPRPKRLPCWTACTNIHPGLPRPRSPIGLFTHWRTEADHGEDRARGRARAPTGTDSRPP